MQAEMISKPILVGKKTAPNRIVFQPMECNDADASGDPSELSIKRYRRFAEGGAGIIFTESFTLTSESRARKSQMAITEKNAEGLAGLVKSMREVNSDSLILFQLNQSGRLSEVAFSKVISVYPTGDPDIHVLTEKEIEEIGDNFVKAAVIAKQVGADGIDFKHCHGYVCTEMIQPANSSNDSLLDLAFDFVVFDDLKVLILAGFFYSCEHGSLLNRHSHYYGLDTYLSMFLCIFYGTTYSSSENFTLNDYRYLYRQMN